MNNMIGVSNNPSRRISIGPGWMIERKSRFASLLVCGLTALTSTGRAETPPPNFLAKAVTLGPSVKELNSQVSVTEFIRRIQSAIGSGTWESDASDDGWIYRIEHEDRLTRRTDSIAILFVDMADQRVWLSRWNFNGVDASPFDRAMLGYRYLAPSEGAEADGVDAGDAPSPNGARPGTPGGHPRKALGLEAPGNGAGRDAMALTAVQRGAISEHVRECWTKDAGALDVDKQRVLIAVTVDVAGIARRVEVAGDDRGRMGDPRFRAFVERVARAVLDVRCANLPLPGAMAGRASVVTFRFSP